MTARPLPEPIQTAINNVIAAYGSLCDAYGLSPHAERDRRVADCKGNFEAARGTLRVVIWQEIDAAARDADRAERILERQIREGRT